MVVPKDMKTILKNLRNNTFIVLVGLPASGKTYLANYCSKLYNLKLLDDPKKLRNTLNFINFNNQGIITDPNLCLSELRKALKEVVYKKHKLSKKLKFVFFENNIDQCLKNEQKRIKSKRAKNDIFYFSTVYKIPANSTILKVFGSK